MAASGDNSGGVRPLERGHPWNARFFEKSPLYWPIVQRARVFEDHEDWPSIAEMDAAWSDVAGIHFHEQPPRARRRRKGRRLEIVTESLYDAQIALSRSVPTRPRNWHDFLNALVWATFSHAKHEFHLRQHAAVAARIAAGARVLPGTRSREMDGLAILDEGGMLMLVEETLVGPMTEWIGEKNLAKVQEAIAEGRAKPVLFGHALYETLLGENAAATWAMVTILSTGSIVPPNEIAQLQVADRHLAQRIAMPGSFADPDQFQNLPLDEGLLCPSVK